MVFAALSSQALANSTNEFPYIAPVHCKDVISAPEGSSPFYRSESCNTVYVLPPEIGALDYSVRLDSVNDLDCDELDNLRVDRKRIHAQKAALQEEAFKPGVPAKKLEVYEKQMELAQKALDQLDKSAKYLGALEGAVMTVRLSAGQVAEVERFFDINKGPFRNGVNFEPAPVAESYVSFDVGGDSTAESRPAVIRTNIPGVEVRGVKSAPQSDSRIMNGSVSGMVVLGLNAVCNMRTAEAVDSVRKISFKPKNMEAYLPANLTFSVPVLSSYSYTASLNYETFVYDVFKFLESKSDKFTVNQYKDRFIEAIGTEHVSWNFTAYEMKRLGASQEQIADLAKTEQDALFAEWARKFADHLAMIGVAEKLEPVPVPAPEAGTEEEIRYRHVCRSKSFVGVRYSHRCWDEPYRVVHLRGGSASTAIHDLRKLGLNFTANVRYSEPIYRTHTITFRYKKAE